MKKIVNLTPHEIVVFNEQNEIIFKFPSEGIARCKTDKSIVGYLNGVPVKKTRFGIIEGLPQAQKGVAYIVSAITAQAAVEREDLYIEEDTVKDDAGRIIGCKSFGKI